MKMRARSVLAMLALAFSLMVGVQLLTSLSVASPISSIINIDPDTLNLGRKGVWITCYIQLPEGYDVNNINVSTILLDGMIPAEWSDVQGEKLMVKFDASQVIDYIWTAKLSHMGIVPPLPKEGVRIELTVTGKLVDGKPFEGSDTIRVID